MLTVSQPGSAAQTQYDERATNPDNTAEKGGIRRADPSRVLPALPTGSKFAQVVLWSALVMLVLAGLGTIAVRPANWPTAGALGTLVLIGTVLAVLGLYRLLMADRRERQRLEALGMTDFTTGVFNRRYLFLRLQNELEQLSRHGGNLSVLYIDLDQFKRVNDKYGHSVGDWVLRRAASLMQSTCRSPDVLGRLGGDEFLIILPRTTPDGAYRAAKRLVDVVKHDVIRTPAGEEIGFVGVSVGIASCPFDGFGTQELITAADQALYKAKQSDSGIHPSKDKTTEQEDTETAKTAEGG